MFDFLEDFNQYEQINKFENMDCVPPEMISNLEKGQVKKVHSQNSIPFWERNRLRADVLVETLDGQRIVIDTKWKVLHSGSPSMGDVRQMFAYNLHYKTKLSILLYPKTSLESNAAKPFRDEQFNDQFCQVAFVDLFDEEDKLKKNIGREIYHELLGE